jgi:hypothetical protein
VVSTDRHLWVLARNAGGRPLCQHAVTSTSDAETVCGYSLVGWSRIYCGGPVAVLACKRCLHRTGASESQRRFRLQLVS